jgi:hypothetical protein
MTRYAGAVEARAQVAAGSLAVPRAAAEAGVVPPRWLACCNSTTVIEE